ncbi:ABC transporter permease [Peptostreptococcus faecalis]|uniref:ABC transporter permease n=1 Tax=Peptostreptococcus faecalis TaxID=2045015 RepID=UPI000C7B6698|nr:ABC transporter permease [Peptostreptococcus faecalis]
MRTFKSMLKTELRLSIRGMDMLIFAICMPLVVLVILGIIYGDKPAFDGAKYSFFEQSFAAVSTIAICAGGVMGLPLVVSDYREKKILKRFKVTPISPLMILFVQITIYALYSVVSLILLYLTANVFFGYQIQGSIVGFILSFIFLMVTLFSIGMMVGGVAPNNKVAGVLASILYFPMIIFSGATLPYEVMPKVLQKMSDIMPLTQGIKLLKATSLGMDIGNNFMEITIMCVISLTCSIISIKYFKWE